MKDTMIDKIKYTYWKHWSYDWRPGQIWYRFKCFAWHRYTTYKPRYLDHTWCDRREIMPHMMFEILCQFIDEECSPGHVEWYGENGHRLGEADGKKGGKHVMDEMKDLIHWWTEVWNKEYPETSDLLWKEAEKHSPIRDFEPIEGQPHLVEWVNTFANDEDEEIYNRCMAASNKLERTMERDREAMLHRIVKIIPYMWT